MTDIKFLTGKEIQKEVQRIMKKKGEATVAVAFWGSKGAKSAGITGRKHGTTRILCDLFSGSCNPSEIELLQNSDVIVRTIDGMHAKVWCVDDEAVVGSANASANGLGFEGAQVVGNVEAAVLVSSLPFANGVRAWFEECWNSQNAYPVGPTDIQGAHDIWAMRKNHRHRQVSRTLMGALSLPEAKSLFSRVRIVVYTGSNVSNEGEKAYNEKGLSTYSEDNLNIYPDALPIYEDDTGWDISPGDIILDFNCSRKKAKPVFGGVWRVRNKNPFIRAPRADAPNNRIILLDPLIDVAGYRLAKSEQEHISALIKARLNRVGWEVNKDGHYLDEKLLDFLREETESKA